MLVNVHAAKSQLSKLIDAALAGEEVVIAKGSKPVVRLVAIPQSGFRFGLLAGKVGTPPDFLAPMPADDLDLWEGAE
jgi:prevent-host-death family protein